MKDAYSFHATQESLQEHYDAMGRAYARICERLGLDFRPVEADSGQIGGKVTTEFMALAESGEAALVYCECGYAANVEAASTVVPRSPAVTEPRPLERIHTPEIRTIAELSAVLGIREHDTVKTMAGKMPDRTLVYFCIPGDRELNPVKAERAVPGVVLLEEEDFEHFGIPKGSLGPAGPPSGTVVIADESLRDDVAWGVGANENDYHLLNAQPGRDFEVAIWADLVVARPGDGCPVCGGTLRGARGIEVSQVFQLGTKYSDSMGATFADESGEERPFLMGCYGVGVSRSAWPVTIAPLEVAILPLNVDGEVFEAGERIWRELADAGVEVVLDDRDERAGVKFNDADLIGWPFQVVVGKKGLAEGVVEVKDRATGERPSVLLTDVVAHVAGLVARAKAALAPKTSHP
jgi:prolyl-tRNA synthetase